MSRQANNLRERLRIANEQTAKLARHNRELTQLLTAAKKEMRREDESFARSIMISVEQDPAISRGFAGPFGVYTVGMNFYPDGYAWHIRQAAREPLNISYAADDIGYRIGKMVARAIFEKLAPLQTTSSGSPFEKAGR